MTCPHNNSEGCPLGQLADHTLRVTRASAPVCVVLLLVDQADPEHVALGFDGIEPAGVAELLEQYAAKLRQRYVEAFVPGAGPAGRG